MHAWKVLCAQEKNYYYVHNNVQCAEIWSSESSMPAVLVVMKEMSTQWRYVLMISGTK